MRKKTEGKMQMGLVLALLILPLISTEARTFGRKAYDLPLFWTPPRYDSGWDFRQPFNMPWLQPGYGGTGSSHGPNWGSHWGWRSSPGDWWGFGSGSGRSTTGNPRGFGFGYGYSNGGSGDGYGFGGGTSYGGSGGWGGHTQNKKSPATVSGKQNGN